MLTGAFSDGIISFYNPGIISAYNHLHYRRNKCQNDSLGVLTDGAWQNNQYLQREWAWQKYQRSPILSGQVLGYEDSVKALLSLSLLSHSDEMWWVLIHEHLRWILVYDCDIWWVSLLRPIKKYVWFRLQPEKKIRVGRIFFFIPPAFMLRSIHFLRSLFYYFNENYVKVLH